MRKLRTLIAGAGILVIVGTAVPAQATTSDSIYNQLSVTRNNAGKQTPVNDSKLRALASNRAKNLASKDSSSASPVAGLPSSMYSIGYKQSSQLWGYHSSGDSQDVADSFIKSQKSTINKTQWNRLGVGQAKSKSGKVYVVAIFAEYKAPVVAKPKPAPAPTSTKPKSSTGGSSSSTGGSSGNGSNDSKPTADMSKVEKELADLKAKQKKDAEKRAKAESDAKKQAEADKKKAEQEAKAKAEQEKKAEEARKKEAEEAKNQAKAEKVEQEKQEAERQAEIERLAIEKKEAEDNSDKLRSTIHKATNMTSWATGSLGILILPLAFLLTRKRRFAPVPDDLDFEQFKKDYLAKHKP